MLCHVGMSEAVIDVRNVRKRYRGGVEALRGISLQVPKGEIFGFLGPNGAGKSTMVKILTSIVRPTSCEGTMLGQKVGDKDVLKRVGYLPEFARFPEYLKGEEVVRYVAGLCGMSSKEAKIKAGELLELVGMSEWGRSTMGSYSKGMKQRIGLAQALVNDPEIVFLDEPTDGVDPRGRKEMRDVLKTMRDQGRTVFVNSHLLGELELICDSVAIMDRGQIVTQGTIKELTQKTQRYEVRYEGAVSEALQKQIEGIGAERDEHTVMITQCTVERVQEVIDLLRKEKLLISDVREVRQNLEELFISSVAESAVGGTQN